MNRQNQRSLILFILSMVIWGSIGIFRRNIPLSSAMLACFRGACGVLVLLGVARALGRKVFQPIGLKKGGLLALSGALMGFNWILLFEAYNYTTVPTATLCYYMQPVIVILLSPLLFHEKITPRKGLCSVIAVAGMVLVSGVAEKGLPEAGEAKGILMGLGAAVLYAMVIVCNKKIPRIDPYEKTILQLLSATIVLIPYVFLSEGGFNLSMDGLGLTMLIIVGVVHTGLAYALYFGSMDGLKAQTVALLSYTDPVVALVLSALLLNEKLSLLGGIGAVLIIGAAIANEVNLERKKGQISLTD